MDLIIFSKDYFQYFWIVQFGSGIGILLNGIQFLKLFPNRVGILLGVTNALVKVLPITISIQRLVKLVSATITACELHQYSDSRCNRSKLLMKIKIRTKKYFLRDKFFKKIKNMF